jgi:hypothetical protein
MSQQNEPTQEQQDKELRGDNNGGGSVVSSFWRYFDSGFTRMMTTTMIMALRNSFLLQM